MTNTALYEAAARDKSLIERLLRDVVHDGECLRRTVCNNGSGYAQVYYKGKNLLSHRVIAIAHGKATASDPCVMHSCDVPNCLFPGHLLGGTHGDNAVDCVVKGRHRSGDRSHLTNREAHPRNKPISDPSGREWPSAALAASHYGFSRAHVAAMSRDGVRGWKKL